MRNTIEIIKCDICGSNMMDGRHHGLSGFTFEYVSRIDIKNHGGTSGYEDICITCNDKILKIIRQIEMEAEAAKEQ